MLLFKYRPWNSFTAQVLTRDEIFFPSRSQLNDMAELVHPVRFESSTWSSTFDSARSLMGSDSWALVDKTYQRLRDLEAAFEAGNLDVRGDSDFGRYFEIHDPFWRKVEACYDRIEVHDAILYYALCLFEDSCNRYADNEQLIGRLNDKIESLGVLSLAARSDCPLMWAHYAQNHQGVVLIFEVDNEPLLRNSRPIEYVNSRPITTVDSVVQNLYRKGKAWEYEMEHRIMIKHGNRTYNFASEALVGIILGIHISEADRREVRSLVSQSNVKAYQAYSDPSEFSILHERVH